MCLQKTLYRQKANANEKGIWGWSEALLDSKTKQSESQGEIIFEVISDQNFV